MTRINLVSPSELCDKHLLAELRELKRIPNAISRGRFSLENQPTAYVLGTGHVKFFYDKLMFLFLRYKALYSESVDRGFKCQYMWPQDLDYSPELWNDYAPTQEAIELNRQRIKDRMPKDARWTKRSKALLQPF